MTHSILASCIVSSCCSRRSLIYLFTQEDDLSGSCNRGGRRKNIEYVAKSPWWNHWWLHVSLYKYIFFHSTGANQDAAARSRSCYSAATCALAPVEAAGTSFKPHTPLISCVTCRRYRKLFKTISVLHQQCHRLRMWFTFSLSMAFGIVHIRSAQSHNIDFLLCPLRVHPLS